VVLLRHVSDLPEIAAITRASAFVAAFEILLALDGPQRVVWAGDYAPDEPGQKANLFFQPSPTHFVRFDVPALGDPADLEEGEHVQPNGAVNLRSCGRSANHISLIRHTRPGESRRRTGENRPRIAQVDSALDIDMLREISAGNF
jgi:hypothetical protein